MCDDLSVRLISDRPRAATPKGTATKAPKAEQPAAAPSPMPTPSKKAAFVRHPLPRTQKVVAADDFGSFGKMTTAQYFGAVKKLDGVSKNSKLIPALL